MARHRRARRSRVPRAAAARGARSGAGHGGPASAGVGGPRGRSPPVRETTMNISLTKLPWWGQIGAFMLLAVAGCGAFWWYIESPARGDMVARETQLTALKADISK